MTTKVDNNTLAVIWSSSNPDVAHSTVFMYTLNAKCREWWDSVHLIIWGPSAALVAENQSIQEKVRELISAGVSVCACKRNSDDYGVSDKLTTLGINVKHMGEPVTEMMKNGARIITF